MRKIAYNFVCLLVIVLMPLISTAHPGHGDGDGHTIIHYFVEPIHAISTISGIFIIVGYIYYRIFVKKNEQIKG